MNNDEWRKSLKTIYTTSLRQDVNSIEKTVKDTKFVQIKRNLIYPKPRNKKFKTGNPSFHILKCPGSTEAAAPDVHFIFA